MVGESDLELALGESWNSETSLDVNNWTKANPAWGQCAVTALIVNDYLGGEIVWASARLPDGKELSHYFNKINNEEKDFTRKQFPEGTQVPTGVPKTKQFSSTREYVLSFEATRIRYELLKSRVKDYLQKNSLE